MSAIDPIELLYGGMHKLGPGSDADTLKVLDSLPARQYSLVVDAGCGSGRQTLVLAERLQTAIHAIDNHASFLQSLKQKAEQAGLEQLVETHCMDIAEIPSVFRDIDLLWSEAAAYSIGFNHALNVWHAAIAPNGLLVVSELCWMHEHVPVDVQKFFDQEYPAMRSVEDNVSMIEQAGYELLGMHRLADETWVDGYYDVLEPRARDLLEHSDATVRMFAAEMLEEIRVFACANGSYAYVFFVLKKPG